MKLLLLLYIYSLIPLPLVHVVSFPSGAIGESLGIWCSNYATPGWAGHLAI